MDKIMTEKGLETCAWLCAMAGIVGASILEWAPLFMPHVSPLAIGIGGSVAAAGCFGLALAFRGE